MFAFSYIIYFWPIIREFADLNGQKLQLKLSGFIKRLLIILKNIPL